MMDNVNYIFTDYYHDRDFTDASELIVRLNTFNKDRLTSDESDILNQSVNELNSYKDTLIKLDKLENT